jgi:hypothetical protein
MSVCAFILCLCCSVCRLRPSDGQKDYETEEEDRTQQKAVEPLMKE